MKIVQITDIHLGRLEDRPMGIDTRKQFLEVLNEVTKLTPDLLVITGDICLKDPFFEAYLFLKDALDRLTFPFRIVSGNHDDNELLVKAFGWKKVLVDGAYYFLEVFEGRKPIYFLDSSKNKIDPKQMAWLSAKIENETKDALIFIHHPPCKSGARFMDQRYPMEGGNDLMKLLQASPRTFHLYCGHHHIDKTILKKNVLVHVTPSTYLQIVAEKIEFEMDHHRAGYRIIDWDETEVRSTVRYVG